MYELFVMALKDYWNEQGDPQEEVNQNVLELQNVLSEHYGVDVHWSEPDPDPDKADEEISVCAFTDEQFVSLQAVAAALELGVSLDDLDLDPENPWDCEVFEKLQDYVDDENNELNKYPHVLSAGQCSECFIVPVDLPFVAEINASDDDEEKHDCHCDDECCCCEDDENCIEISSLIAMRRELDNIAKVLNVKDDVSLESLDELSFDDDDTLREAKVAWYVLSNRVNEALKANLPLILSFNDEEGDFDDEADED